MKKALAVLSVIVGIVLTVLWFRFFPRFPEIFEEYGIMVGFFIIPGWLLAYMFMLLPTSVGIIIASYLWKK